MCSNVDRNNERIGENEKRATIITQVLLKMLFVTSVTCV